MEELVDGLLYRCRHIRVWEYRLEGAEVCSSLSPHGGRTVVDLGRIVQIDEDTKTFEVVCSGEARCSPRDNYNRKRGRDIALGRALKAYTS